MFDFVKKPFLWKAWEEGLADEIGDTDYFHLKSIQDLAVYTHLREYRGANIAEIGGGASRLLETLAKNNDCYNIDKFEGDGGGPSGEVAIRGVQTVRTFLGEQSPLLRSSFFDVVFSISVVEHVPTENLPAFFADGLRILKPGGLWIHAIDMYLEDEPAGHHKVRYDAYRNWLRSEQLEPTGPINDGPLAFSCDMATNPDNIMYRWGRIAPALTPLRQKAQSVSLLLAACKR